MEEKKKADWTRSRIPNWAKMLAVVAVVLLLMAVTFRVSTFHISGNTHYTEQEIADASGITEGDILMAVSKVSTAGKLMADLPYLEKVTIRKQMPHTICITVEECTAAAMFESDVSQTWLVSSSGKLLENVDSDAETGCPKVTGPQVSLPSAGDMAQFSNEDQGNTALKICAIASELGILDKITEVNVSDMTDIYVIYDNRLELELGDSTDLDYKLEYFQSVEPQLETNAEGTLDITFADGNQAVFHRLNK